MSDKLFISLPYIYPVCPLNIDHSRMFIIADVIARHSRKKGKQVVFLVASHYSGNTAEKIAEIFSDVYLGKKYLDDKHKNAIKLFKDMYGASDYILREFVDPIYILDYYSQEILWELKSLNISCDYQYFYNTKLTSFSYFVNEIISRYEKSSLLIKNEKNELALDYNNKKWSNMAEEMIEKSEFLQAFHKNTIKSAKKNVRSDWGLLRDCGFGVKYKNRYVIDPMFDSELFTVFDLYMRFKDEYSSKEKDLALFFNKLFDVLVAKSKTNDELIKKIVSYLPCDVFVCEEHLKNWVVKRMFAESFLLEKKYHTKKYFMTGMGLLNGKRMSASKGNAILSKDLIVEYGSVMARLIILLTGGHPSKIYHYNNELPQQAKKMLDNFNNYLFFLLIAKEDTKKQSNNKLDFSVLDKAIDSIERNIEDGLYRQAIIELITIVPKKFKKPNKKVAERIMALYDEYLEILLPGLLNDFNIKN